jgi:BirA family biotin operon repressor/biotin-[acetyl-CoA-carboxylase] ligase
MAELDARVAQPAHAVLAALRKRDALLGRPVRWSGGEGLGAGIDEAGALLVETATGTTALSSGEVHLLA